MFWRRRDRLDEEVASHIAEETADNVARGMEPAAAREAALRSFGNVEAAKETVRERNLGTGSTRSRRTWASRAD